MLRSGSVKGMAAMFQNGLSNITTTKTQIENFDVGVATRSQEIDSKEKQAREKVNVIPLVRTKENVPKDNAIYIHPFSKENKFEVFTKNGKEAGSFAGFINTSCLDPGDYNCKPHVEVGKNKIPLTEFGFKVQAHGNPIPDFLHLEVVDLELVLTDKDEPIDQKDAKCKFTSTVEQLTFECQTDSAGKIRQVLPPGHLRVEIESCGRSLETQLLKPTPVTDRNAAMRTEPYTYTKSYNTKLAGSSMSQVGNFVILGDASCSMRGKKFDALIKSLTNFVNAAIERDQQISIAVWGSGTNWFNNGYFITANDLPALQVFLENNSKNNWNTYLEPSIDAVFYRYPNIENILVFCDGEIQDIRSVEEFENIRNAHPKTKFHFTGIGSKSPENLNLMAQRGDGRYEFSGI